jgi:DnaJ homologue, subfamily C, member 28, conserved domain
MASQIEKLIDEWLAQKPDEDLPGRGKPLDLDDYFGWPEERRMAYSLLKNAGCVPFEVELLQEIASLQQSIEGCTDPEKLHKLWEQLQARQVELNLRLEERRRRPYGRR